MYVTGMYDVIIKCTPEQATSPHLITGTQACAPGICGVSGCGGNGGVGGGAFFKSHLLLEALHTVR